MACRSGLFPHSCPEGGRRQKIFQEIRRRSTFVKRSRAMVKTVNRILQACGTSESHLPPTELFNEGWMLRLILDYFSRHRDIAHPLAFEDGATWYSEALLHSRFLPTFRGDRLAESFTHADGVIGHFAVQPGVRGDAVLQPRATQLIVTEAKLASSLSAGTKNAADFDQAARNVACIAHMLSIRGAAPADFSRLGFYVLAPHSQIGAGVFASLVTKDSIRQKVLSRIAAYAGKHDEWYQQSFLPVLECIDLDLLSWESVLESIPASPDREDLQKFYAQCLRFNPIRALRT